MTDRYDPNAPFSTFGTVSVTPLYNNDGTAPDWTPQPVLVSKHVPGGNVNIRQDMGDGPLQYVATVRLLSDADYQTLRGLLGTAATLRLLREASGDQTGTDELRIGQAYTSWTNVTLMALGNVVRRRDGTVLCQATWERDES